MHSELMGKRETRKKAQQKNAETSSLGESSASVLTLQTAAAGPQGKIHPVQSLLKRESGCVETPAAYLQQEQMMYIFQKKNIPNMRNNQMPLWLEAFGKISYRIITSMSTINFIKVILSWRGYIATVLTNTRSTTFQSER